MLKFCLTACCFVLATSTGTALTQEYPQPVEQHHQLLATAGDWEGTMTSFLPEAPTEPIPATETVTPFGGFFTQARFECQFMGQPYIGTGCMGYDPARSKYVGTWIDSMSSHLAVMEGERDPESGALVMHWTAPGMTGGMVAHRSVTVRTEDSYTSTFYMGEGEGSKTMVIAMKRKQPATGT